MKALKTFKGSLKDTRQLTRIVIFTGLALILGVISFASYYYVDRYVPPVEDVSPSERSIAELEAMVDKDPKNLELRLTLAETYMINMKWDDAIRLAERINQSYPDEDRAMLVLGVSYASTKRPEKALQPLQEYIAIHEKSPMANLDTTLEMALYYLGDSYLQLNRPKDAIQPFERAVQINQTEADDFYKLGLAYAGDSQHQKAIEAFEKAVLFVPNFSEAYQGMVASYLALNQPVGAAYARGMLAFSVLDYEGARAELETAVTQDPNFAPVYLGLGLTYEQLGELQTAKVYADRAVELNPENFAAIQLQGRLAAALDK